MNQLLKVFFILLLLFFANSNSTAQYTTSAAPIGSSQHDEADDVYADDSGNVYMFGSHNASITKGSKTIKNFGGVDNYLIKFDCKGTIVWSQTVGSSGNEVVYFLGMDNDIYGNVYITGGYAGTATLTSEDGNDQTLTSQGGLDIYVAKYAPSGNLLWTNSFGGSSNDIGHDIAIDNNLNYFITGEFFGSAVFDTITLSSSGSSDVFLIKSDSTGHALWGIKGSGSGDDVGTSVQIDKTENIIICGYAGMSGATMTMGSKTTTSSTFHTGFLARISKSGTCLWMQCLYSSGGNLWLECSVDRLNNIYTSGYNKGSSTVTSSDNNNIALGSGIGDYDVNIAKFDSLGVAKWAKLYGSTGLDQGYAITLGNNDSLIFIGCKLGGQITYASKTSTYNGGDDYWIASLDTSGKVLWYDYGGGSSNDGAQGLYIDKYNFIYVAAFFESSSTIVGQSLSANGSSDALLVTYTKALPTLSLGAATKNICSGDSVTINIPTYNWVQYLWNNGATTSSITVKPIVTTTYILMVYTGCDTAYDSIKIIVNNKPIADFSTVGNSCTANVTFQNNSTGFNTIDWAFGDGNTGTNTGTFSHNYGSSGSYSIKLVATATGGCKDSIVKNININSDSINTSAFKVSQDTGCSPFICTFTNISSGATNYIWDFGDGNSDTNTNTNHIYSAAGTFKVKLCSIDSLGCKLIDSTSASIIVQPQPVPSFTNAQQGCTPTLDFTNVSTGATIFSWDLGDGNTNTNKANFSHTYSSNGSYFVKLVASSLAGCKDSVVKKVIVSVDSVNNASFSVSSTSGCPPLNCTFTNKSNGASNYIWDFGDGNSSTNININHIYNTAGSFIVKLYSIDSFGCKQIDSATTTINVQAAPLASYTFSQQPCTRTIDFTNTSTGGLSYTWNFGDGNTDTLFSPSHSYNSLTTYQVLLTVTGANCSDTESIYIPLDIDSLNTAVFNADNITGCAPITINFTNKSIGAVNYFWDFGDGGVDNNTNTSHTFATAGVYIVKLVSLDPSGCKQSDTAYKTITIITAISADFTYDLNTCNGEVIFTDNQTNSNKWEWYIGNDTLTYKTKNAIHKFNFDGLYDVKYKIYSGKSCVDSIIKTLDLQGISNALFLPDAFSPNGDGLNDKFEILGNLKCIENFSLEIFNRWGEKVFSTTDITNFWDGKTSNKKEVPEGVYIYILKTKEKDFAGRVKLVR
ncbi:MAG: PKD domain-containing protein [Bacteroidota bacterium]|nr:PKD domain-containing protein [Bacteroidota bacterium]